LLVVNKTDIYVVQENITGVRFQKCTNFLVIICENLAIS